MNKKWLKQNPPFFAQVFASYEDNHPLDEEELADARMTVVIKATGGATTVTILASLGRSGEGFSATHVLK